jgi:hypothetical protein
MRIRIRTDISLPDGAEVQISHLASSKTWFDLDGGFGAALIRSDVRL